MVLVGRVSRSLSGAFCKTKTLWLALGTTGLGALLGLAMATSLWELTVSIVGILVQFVVTAVNPLNGLLLWMVSSPFGDLYISISLGASLPDLSPTRFCVVFLLSLLLAQTAIRKRTLVPSTATDVAAVLFMAGLGLSIINEHSGWYKVAQEIFDNYYVPLLVYFFAKNLVSSRRDVDKVLGMVLSFGLYAALYAIYEVQTENILFTRGEVFFTQYKDSGLHVLRGLLGRSDHFGALFSMVIPVSFYLYIKARTLAKKGLYGIALGVLFIGIFFTYKRTAWIALIAILFLIQWFYPQFRRLFFAILLVFLVVLAVTWNSVSQSVIVTDRINSKVSTVEGRTDGWNAAIALWARQPIFGYGFGTFRTVAEKEGVDDAALENEHLSILFGAGLLGFLPYVAWLALLLRDSIRLFRKSRQGEGEKPYVEWELICIFWGVLLAYLINYSASTAGVFPVTMVFYLLIGALVGSQARFLASSRVSNS